MFVLTILPNSNIVGSSPRPPHPVGLSYVIITQGRVHTYYRYTELVPTTPVQTSFKPCGYHTSNFGEQKIGWSL